MKATPPSDETTLYELCPPKFWDLRFSVVIEGMLGGDDWDEITRAGPFVPPISFPTNSIVVTSSFRDRLDKAGLGVFEYRPIVKRHIVELQWHEWDRSSRPRGITLPRDVGAYLDSAPHSASCAKQMEDLWELLLPVGPQATTYNLAGRWGRPELSIIDRKTVQGHHISESQGISLYVLSARAKDFLASEAREWASFEPLYFAPPPRPPFVMVNEGGVVVENPTRDEALDYAKSLGSQESRGMLRLINSCDWFILLTTRGYVEMDQVNASHQHMRVIERASRETQLELWMAFYDRDLRRIEAADWQIVQNPDGTGPVGPGTVEWQEDQCEHRE
jgi:hypothetical protein